MEKESREMCSEGLEVGTSLEKVVLLEYVKQDMKVEK